MRRALFIAAGIGGLIALGFWFANVRATQLINTLLRDFATAETARLSDSVYVLRVGVLHVNWPRRRVTLDSVRLTTDVERNDRRPQPLAAASVALRNCTLGGISLSRLLLYRGLAAGVFGCRDVEFMSEAQAGPPDAARLAVRAAATVRADSQRAAPVAFLALQQTLQLPRQVPRLRIARISFPNVSISLIQHYELRKQLTFVLERAQLHADGLAIDPGDPDAASRTLFSRSVTLSAQNALFLPDTATSASVAQLDVDFTDSSLTIHGLAYGPHISDVAFAQQSPWRRDRIRASAESLTVRGMDIDRFARTGSVRIRTLELDSLRFEIRSDKRRPSRPGRPVPRRSVQAFMAASTRSWQIDTIHIRRSEVVYEEFARGRDTPGRMVFGRLEAVGTSFRHARGAPSTAHPFSLEATALLMGRGQLRATFEIPLDAPSFTLRARGSLGPMPGTALNPFISAIMPAAVKEGELQGLTFALRVTDGHAAGQLTPLYTGLKIDVTGRGMTGVMGSPGLIGGIVRGAAELAAGWRVRGSNPSDPGATPRAGTINHTFHGETLPAFFWSAIRTGLLPVIIK